MLDIIRLIRALLELFVMLRPQIMALLTQPLLTVAMLLFAYAGWHVRDEGSIAAGLHVAFIDTRAYRVEHMRELESAMLQAEMHRTAETDKLIYQLLSALLARAPTAARVRLGVVHNGVTGVTGMALLRVDMTNAVASAGHSIGMLDVNQPLADWNEFLPALLAGKCQMGVTAVETSLPLRAQLEALGAGAFMACPVIDIQARMLGGVFVTWDLRDPPPSGDELQSLMEFARSICVQIASALDLRGHVPWPMGVGVDG